MPDPTVYWHGSVVAWQMGNGPVQVVWCLSPAETVPVAKPKAKRGK
jgi:hypothetical protein